MGQTWTSVDFNSNMPSEAALTPGSLRPRARESLFIGVDLVTSAVKVLATTPGGDVVAAAAGSYALQTPSPGAVELAAEEVVRATLGALREVIARARELGTLRAIGFSCALHGFVPVDARGEPVGAFITWLDSRSARVAERWHADGSAARLYARTGAPVHAMLPSCKLRWFAEHDPAYLARASKYVSLKELIVHRWTGEWLVDYGMASGTGLFDLRCKRWDDGALCAAGITQANLSAPASTRTNLTLRPGIAADLGVPADTRVVLGSSDGALANLGVGAVESGDFALGAGTSGALRVVTAEPHFDAAARTFCYVYDDERYIVGGATSSAGAVLRRFADLVLADVPPDKRPGRAIEEATNVPAGARGVTVLPFLAGERAPYWRADLRGAILGLGLEHTRGDVLRAAFESVAYGLRSVYDVVRERIPAPQQVRLAGGLTSEPFVRQLFADVFGIRAMVTDRVEASAFGAAMTAAITLGSIADDRTAAAALRPRYEHVPRPREYARYSEAYARYARAAGELVRTSHPY